MAASPSKLGRQSCCVACLLICVSIQKHKDRRFGTTACPACWGMGTHKVKNCVAMKKYCVLTCILPILVVQPRQDKNLLYMHAEPNKPTKKWALSYVQYSLSPICLSFNSQQGPPLSSLSSFKFTQIFKSSDSQGKNRMSPSLQEVENKARG